MSETLIDRKAFLAGVGVLAVGFGMAGSAPLDAADVVAKPKGASEANPRGTKSYPEVDSWLALDATGGVTILFGKVELGTGVETAIMQLVADELAVPFSRVRVIQGDTQTTPDQGYTSGSQTLTGGAVPVRRAAAEARLVLLGLGAQHLGVPTEQLTVRDGTVVDTSAHGASVTYATLLGGKRFDRTYPDDIALLPPSAFRYTGKPVPRVDIPGKIAGSYPYLQNLRIAGMVHARMILPPSPGAKLSSYDPSSLRDVPAKIRIFRKDDILAVIADQEWHAVRAAQDLAVTWTGGEGFPAYGELWDVVRKTPGTERTLIGTDAVDGAIAGAKRTLSARYEWPFQGHGSIGPSCAIADVTGDRAVVWAATQGVFPLRGAIAQLLGVPNDRVRVRYAEGAGCYGHNGADDVAGFAALISQSVHAPVRLQYMRADETKHEPKGPAMVHEMRGAIGDDGALAAWDLHVWTPTHSTRPDGLAANTLPGMLTGSAPAPIVFIGGDRNAPNNYTIPTQRVAITDQKTAILRQSALRGLGSPQNTFANESFMDELAHLAGADPFAFRRQHLREERELAVLDAVRDDYKHGRGVAFVHYENTQALVAAVADVTVDRATGGIRVNHLWIAHDCGLVVNPDGVRNQIEGNAVQATSRAIKEQVRFDPHNVLAMDWRTYPILRFSEVPEVTVRLIDRPNEKVLGAGEATTAVIAPAIANAVFAQTGARLRRVPFTPESVLTALRARERTASS